MAPRMLKMPLGKEIVHIKVGTEEQDFGIHKKLISHHSPYFRAAFTSEFEDAKTGIMKLPGTDAKIFEIFYGWLYRQKLWDKDAPREDWPDTEDLVKLYIFADMARIPSLQNQALRAIHIYQTSTRTSHSSCWTTCVGDFSSEARMDIIKAMNRTLDTLIKPVTKLNLSPLNKVRDYYMPQEESAFSGRESMRAMQMPPHEL